MQNAMRTEKRKTLKRGRKKGSGKKDKKGAGKKDKKDKKGKGTYSRKGSKRSVLKASLKRSTSSDDTSKPKRSKKSKNAEIETPIAPDPAHLEPASSGTKRKGKAEAKTGEIKAKKVYQNRIGEGKNWQYEVVEGQVFGCSNCRFIYNGCRGCKKPGFKGRTAKDVLAEAKHENEEASGSKEEKGGVAKKTEKVKKVKKSC